MPIYEYQCSDCRKEFTKMMSISEKEKEEPSCPHCQSKEVKQQIAAFHAITSRKS